MDYDTYVKIYKSTESSILKYACPVWRFTKYNPLEGLQYRAILKYLGVDKRALILSITGDTDWSYIHMKTQYNMIKLWCQLCKMPDYRLCRKAFIWNLNISDRTWSNDIKT